GRRWKGPTPTRANGGFGCSLLRLAKGRLDRSLKSRVAVDFDPLAVDEKRGGAGDSQLHRPLVGALRVDLGVFAVEAGPEALGVKADLGGVPDQVFRRVGAPVAGASLGKEHLLIGPKSAFDRGAVRGLGRRDRLGAQKGEESVGKPYGALSDVLLDQRFDHLLGCDLARRALKVHVLLDEDGGVGPPDGGARHGKALEIIVICRRRRSRVGP